MNHKNLNLHRKKDIFQDSFLTFKLTLPGKHISLWFEGVTHSASTGIHESIAVEHRTAKVSISETNSLHNNKRNDDDQILI